MNKIFTRSLITIVLILIIGSSLGYAMLLTVKNKESDSNVNDKVDDNNKLDNDIEDNLSTKENKKVRLINTVVEGKNIVQEYEIELNGKKQTKRILFYEDEETYNYELKAELENKIIYTYIDIKELVENNIFDVKTIENNFNENNFYIIKGQDGKDYLGIRTYRNIEIALGLSENLLIFNDDFEAINKDREFTFNNHFQVLYLEDDASPWYDDIDILCHNNSNCQIRIKIEDDKFYFLFYDNSYENSNKPKDEKYVEERVYTINDNTLTYEITKKYKVTKVVDVNN